MPAPAIVQQSQVEESPASGEKVIEEPLKLKLRWLFLGALILILWQVPLINMAYRQAGIRSFLQAAFHEGELPSVLPWRGQLEADLTLATEHLEQANRQVIPLQKPLITDRSLGVIALMKGDASQAQQLLLRYLENTPEDYIARFFLGETYRRLGDPSSAIDQWLVAGAQAPLMDLAQALLEREQQAEALAALEAAMQLDETYTQPHWLAGTILAEQGATEEALVLFQEIRRLDPNSEAAHRRAADLFLKQGDLEQALAVYQEMIELAPQRPLGYALMGQALFEAGQSDQAIEFLQQALQRDPENSDMLLEILGQAYAAAARWTEAIQIYEQLIALNPNRPQVYSLMGKAQCESGSSAEARFYFEQAVALGDQQEQLQQTIQYIAQQGVCPP